MEPIVFYLLAGAAMLLSDMTRKDWMTCIRLQYSFLVQVHGKDEATKRMMASIVILVTFWPIRFLMRR